MRRGLAVLGLVALGLAGLTACSDDKPTAAGAIVVVPEAKRELPVDLAGTTLEGQPLDVGSFRGHPVVINVWGSWCGPCRKEAPELEQAMLRLRADGVGFLGITTRDDVAQAQAFQRRFGVTYPSLNDGDGRLLLALRGAVSANSVPATVVLDDRGRIAARITGATTEATLVDVVSDVVGRELGTASPAASGSASASASGSSSGSASRPPSGSSTSTGP